jgi:hypothetical protein
MNITETNEMKARIEALEARVKALEMSQFGQKSANIPASHVANGQSHTLSLKKA